MGWMETCAVEERMRFVMAITEREEAFAAVCQMTRRRPVPGRRELRRHIHRSANLFKTARHGSPT
jgi:hypothetical protein